MPAVTACPDRNELASFARGEKTPADIERVAEHLEYCSPCAETVDHLLSRETLGDLVVAVRAHGKLPERPAEPSVTSLIEKLCALEPSSVTLDQSAEATPPPDRDEDTDVKFLNPAQADDELGRLGSYRVLKLLGRGGMGLVFLAEDVQLRRPVALKVMRPSLAAGASARTRFLREAQAAAALRHDRVVTIYQVGEDRGVPFLAMELLEGQSLEDRLKENPRPPIADVISVGRQIAEGLAAAHGRGLIHRDIKPANVFLVSSGEVSERDSPLTRVKILDFGLARLNSGAGQLTQSGAIVGTPAYMAPEQARGTGVDARSDLFGLGAVLYRMATGRTPFSGTDTMSMLMSLASDTPQDPRMLNPELPTHLADLIMRLLEKDPANRPQSARDVIGLLIPHDAETLAPDASEPRVQFDVGADDAKIGVATAATNRLPSQRQRSRRLWIGVAAAFAFLIGGGLTAYKLVFETKDGTLIVEVADSDTELRFKNGELQILDDKGNVKYTLKPSEKTKAVAPGDYTVTVASADGVEVVTPEFKMTKGGKATVRVRAVAPKPPPAPAPEPEDPDRSAAEYVRSIGGQIWIDDQEHNGQLPEKPFRLTGFSLNSTNQVTDGGLAHFKGCKNLTGFTLIDTPVTDAGLAQLKDGKNLTYLSLVSTRVTDAGLAHFKDCKNLLHLFLFCTQVTDKGLAHLKDCKNLTHLHLQGEGITDLGLIHLKDCKNLTLLLLTNTQVTDAGLANFKDCKNLTNLDLAVTRVTDLGLAHFKDCKNLTYLNLGHTQVTNAGLAHFKVCKSLKHLDLSYTPVTEAGLAHFKDCKSLTNLDLNLTGVTDAGLAHFKDCKDLGQLLLRGTLVTDIGLAHFKNCKHLVQLGLQDVQVTDAGLANFKDCKNLVSLGINGTLVTDAGLAHFKDAKNLTHLDLRATRVTDSGLDVLVGLTNLGELGLENCRISRYGYEQLKAAMPKVNSAWSQPNSSWSEPNRRAAEGVMALGGAVEISEPGKPARPVKPGEALPDKFFQVRRVVLKDVGQPLGDLPATLSLLSFAEFDRLETIDLTGTPLQDVAFLATIHGLQDVSLAKTGIGDGQLATLPKLKRLVLDGNAIRGPGLENLAKQAELSELSLGATGQTDDDLARLPKLPQLRKLVLDGNPVRGQGLVPLQRQPELIELSLARTLLTDLTVKNLSGLKRLNRLYLAGTSLSDAGLGHLEVLTNLQELDLTGTKVTVAGVAALQKALPKCKIVSPAPRPPLPRGDSSLDTLDAKDVPPSERFPWQPDNLVGIYGSHNLRHWGNAHGVVFSKDGKRFNSWGPDGHRLWDAKSGKELAYFDPKGRWVMTSDFATIAYMTADDAGRVIDAAPGQDAGRVIDAAKAKERFTFRGKAPIWLSPDSKYLIVTDHGDQAVHVLDMSNGKDVRTLPVRQIAGWMTLAFSTDGQIAAGVSADNPKAVKVWDVDGWNERATLEGHAGEILGLMISPDGKTIATASIGDKTFRLWDGETGKQRFALDHAQEKASPESPDAPPVMAFSNDGKSVATAFGRPAGGGIKVWDVGTGKLRTRIGPQAESWNNVDWVDYLLFAGDDEFLIDQHGPAGSWSHRGSYAFRVATGERLNQVLPPGMASCAPDGHTIAFAGPDGVVRLFDLSTMKQIAPLDAGPSSTQYVGFARDGRTLVSKYQDGTVIFWDTLTSREQTTLKPPPLGAAPTPTTIPAIAPDGKLFAWGSWWTLVRFWDLEAGKELPQTIRDGNGHNVLAFSPDGQSLAVGTHGSSQVEIRDTASGKLRAALKGHTSFVVSLAFSPNGQILASGGADETIRLWDLKEGKERATIPQRGTVRSLAFSNDGNSLAVGSNELKLFDVTTTKESANYPLAPGVWVNSVIFAPDGTLFSADSGGRVIQWTSAIKTKEWCKLPGPVLGIALSKDGRHLATANSNGTIYVLRLAPAVR